MRDFILIPPDVYDEFVRSEGVNQGGIQLNPLEDYDSSDDDVWDLSKIAGSARMAQKEIAYRSREPTECHALCATCTCMHEELAADEDARSHYIENPKLMELPNPYHPVAVIAVCLEYLEYYTPYALSTEEFASMLRMYRERMECGDIHHLMFGMMSTLPRFAESGLQTAVKLPARRDLTTQIYYDPFPSGSMLRPHLTFHVHHTEDDSCDGTSLHDFLMEMAGEFTIAIIAEDAAQKMHEHRKTTADDEQYWGLSPRRGPTKGTVYQQHVIHECLSAIHACHGEFDLVPCGKPVMQLTLGNRREGKTASALA